ncbi:MAG: SH3 domain-containing protein, partial [Eubacterium sp.]|nr:SH3 domain-containing protein [Eubacterium sp.]
MKSNIWKKLFIIETILVVFASIVLFVYITKPDEGSVEDESTAVESYYVDSNDLNVDVENSTETDSIESTKTDSDNVDNIQADIDVEEVKDKIIYMPGVTEEMSNPEYWIDIQEEPDKVLITKPQIEALNKKIVETSGCRMYDLESYSEDEAEFGIVVRQTDVKGSPTNSLMNGSDANFDDNQLAGAKVNDPVCIIGHSEDDSFYKVRTRDYEGWIRSEDVALCSNKEEWLKAWKFTEEGNFVVVTTDRIFTEDN